MMRLRAILTQVGAADDIDDHGPEGHCNFVFFSFSPRCTPQGKRLQPAAVRELVKDTSAPAGFILSSIEYEIRTYIALDNNV